MRHEDEAADRSVGVQLLLSGISLLLKGLKLQDGP